MRRYLVLVAVCSSLLVASPVSAGGSADSAARSVKLSIHLGLASSTLATEPDAGVHEPSRMTGRIIGVGARVPFGESFALQLAVGHKLLGAMATVDDGSTVFEGERPLELGYVDVEAIATWRIVGQRRVSAFYGAGAAFGLLTGVDGVGRGRADDVGEDDFSLFDMAGALTTGVDIDLGGGTGLTVALTYRHGFSDTLRSSRPDSEVRAAVRNRSVGVTTGLSF